MKDKKEIEYLKEKFFREGGKIKKLCSRSSYYPSRKTRWHYKDKPSVPEWLDK